ncbi:MAG: hypothetical protein IKR73_07685, partial [Oscillospiraceae bacterium]|nr:hypothetical protein [Oscillospiraceae bacterium]
NNNNNNNNNGNVNINNIVINPQISWYNVGNGKVSLKWNAINGATSYNVYYYYNGKYYSGGYSRTNSITIKNLTNNMPYRFKVKATVKNKTCIGDFLTSNITPKNYGIKVNARPGINKVTLTWNRITNVSKYRAIVKQGSTTVKSVTTTGTAATINGLEAGRTYQIFVLPLVNNQPVIFDPGAAEDRDYVVTVTPVASPNITSYAAGATYIRLNYEWIAGAERYRIYSIENGSNKLIGTTTSTSFTASNLKRNTRYQFFILAEVNGQLTGQRYVKTIYTAN